METDTETGTPHSRQGQNDTEKQGELLAEDTDEEWDKSTHNPRNWPTGRKLLQLAMLSSSAFLAYVNPLLLTIRERKCG